MIMTDIQSNNVSNPDTHSNTLSETHFEAVDNFSTLKYEGQTPKVEPEMIMYSSESSHKRVCTVLSPIERETSEDNNLVQLIQTTIKVSINDIILTMFANLKHEMKEWMANMINGATEDMKKKVLSEVKKNSYAPKKVAATSKAYLKPSCWKATTERKMFSLSE